MVARSSELHFPPNEHRMGTLCLCDEPAHVPAVPPGLRWIDELAR